jgi:hypothetical protein
LERWKKRILAAFLLSSLVVGVSAVLLFEAAGVAKVWRLEFGSAAQFNSKATNACEVSAPAAPTPLQR